MRIALCFSGLTRFWEATYNFYKENLVKEYDPDIFIHTWYDNDPNENKEVILAYNPKIAAFDRNNEIKLPQVYTRGIEGNNKAYNIFSFYKSMKASNEIKSLYEEENGFKYDWVFRLRFDYALNRKFDLFTLNNDKIHLPSDLSDRNLITDQFAFSSSQNMNIYSSVYGFLDAYYNSGEDMIGESMLVRHLTENKIYDKRQYHDMNHPFHPSEAVGSLPNSLIRSKLVIKDDAAIKYLGV